MKKSFFKKPKPKRKKAKKFFFFLLFILTVTFTYQFLNHSNIIIDDKELVEVLLSNQTETSVLKKIITTLFPTKKEAIKTLIKANYKGLITDEKEKKAVPTMIKKENKPLIYIYNTHQTEEYTPSSLVEYSIMPTVQMNNYILEDRFEEKNYETVVEEKNIKEVLNKNGWNYAKSYQASRTFLEEAKRNYPTLKYFIDVHRDSLPKERTTVTLNNKNYATILFLIGLENKDYAKNLEFTEKINAKINEKYPGLSKGIYKKQGEGVNGVYNQDFSTYTILVEMGGPENTIDEVLNTSLAFSECFLEVIDEYEL